MILLQPSTIGINYVGYKEFFSEKGENLRSFGERRIELENYQILALTSEIARGIESHVFPVQI